MERQVHAMEIRNKVQFPEETIFLNLLLTLFTHKHEYPPASRPKESALVVEYIAFAKNFY